LFFIAELMPEFRHFNDYAVIRVIPLSEGGQHKMLASIQFLAKILRFQHIQKSRLKTIDFLRKTYYNLCEVDMRSRENA
jgi:hypothetical protein